MAHIWSMLTSSLPASPGPAPSPLAPRLPGPAAPSPPGPAATSAPPSSPGPALSPSPSHAALPSLLSQEDEEEKEEKKEKKEQEEEKEDDEDEDDINPFPALPARPTALMNVLSALPPVRNAKLRPNLALNVGPKPNVEAIMMQMVGAVAATPCRHCAKGNGKFVECVAVAGQAEGSCGNCHYNNEGVRCSLRPAASAASVAAAINQLPVPDVFGNLAARSTSPATRSTTRHAVLTAVNPLALLPAGGVRIPRQLRAKRLHALARYHLAVLEQSRTVSEGMLEIAALHREIAIFHEKEADWMDENGDVQ
ncbi:MAG: hypothetical protein M1829_001983 [Trizodia sp. TS-e1964]|nr:MAG: hypothetical protein M1829_001983 [Trizodia sp. TS-e1964]